MTRRSWATAMLLACASATAGAAPGGGSRIARIEPHFIALEDIAVPIVDGDTLGGQLRFKAVIAAPDDSAAARLAAIKPVLRSQSIIAAIEFSRLHASGLRPVDADALAHALDAALKPRNKDVGRVLLVMTGAQAA